jgi:hypothetical protein
LHADKVVLDVPEGYVLYDVDVAPSGGCVAVFRSQTEINQPVLLVDERIVHLPSEFLGRMPGSQQISPRIRALGNTGSVLLFLPWFGDDRANGWIINPKGDITTSFDLGVGIQDVLTDEDLIVVTYFDEGVFSHHPHSQQGVAVFGRSGEFLAGYHERFRESGTSIADCYAACWHRRKTVAFFPYTEFPLVIWDLANNEHSIYDAARLQAGSDGLTTYRNTAFFHSVSGAVFGWKIGTNEWFRTESLIPGEVRGLPGGRFLTMGEQGYTVWTISEVPVS